MVKKEWTDNECIAMMHKERANSFRMVADWVEKHKVSWSEVVKLLRDSADEAEAQIIVVNLRDSKALNP